jgi:dTMP kinase
MKGKLITIESGVDASGKATQTAMLFDRLKAEGYNIKKVEFPNYKSPSSVFVRMYLDGRFGDDPEQIDPYKVSPMFALDRYCSYKESWEGFYNSGGIIIADRYTTSNMVYQASKIDNREAKDRFLDWLWDLEFDIYGLPVPDMVLFLNVPPDIGRRLMENRANKFDGGSGKDIHESDAVYLSKTYDNALYVAEKYKWIIIDCYDKDSNRMYPVERIHHSIYGTVSEFLRQAGD